MTIRENIETVRENMARACQRAGRRIDEVTLIAVTKYVETARIAEAVAAGVTDVGENRAQEFTEKLTFYEQKNSFHISRDRSFHDLAFYSSFVRSASVIP